MYEEAKQFLELLFAKDDLIEFRLIEYLGDGVEGRAKVIPMWAKFDVAITDEFLSKPIPIRMLVVFAGPFMNFILAFIIMWLLIYIGGVGTVSTIKIGVPDKNTPAYKSELQKGDKILTINAEKVNSWDDILEKLYPNNKMHSNNIELQIQRIDSTGKRIITVELQNDNNYSHWGLNPLFTNGALNMEDGCIPNGKNERA